MLLYRKNLGPDTSYHLEKLIKMLSEYKERGCDLVNDEKLYEDLIKCEYKWDRWK